jgi:hypothetical protein
MNQNMYNAKQMKKVRLMIGILALLAASLFPVKDVIDVNIGIDGLYTDNIFLNISNTKDYVSRFSAELNIPLKRFNVYLGASADIYAENPDFNSFYLEPGIDYFHPLKGRNSLFLGLGFRVLNYKEIYTDFNYNGPQLQAGIKLYTAPQAVVKAGYRFQSRNYANWESFDFYNHNGFVEFDRFFRSQTTLMIKGGFNYRHYPHILKEFDFGENFNYFNNHGTHGQGSGHGSGSGQGPGGMNPHFPPGTGPGQAGYNKISIPNAYAFLAVRQAVGTRLGITAEAEVRKHFSDLDFSKAETLIKNAYVLYPYNDDFLWEGTRLGLVVKSVLFKGFTVEASAHYYDKSYPGVDILDEAGNVIEPVTERQDRLLLYRLRASQKIAKLNLSVTLLYRDNDSNDTYFFYKMTTVSAGVSVFF